MLRPCLVIGIQLFARCGLLRSCVMTGIQLNYGALLANGEMFKVAVSSIGVHSLS